MDTDARRRPNELVGVCYRITVYGCDDSTTVERRLTEAEFAFTRRLAAEITQASEYGCMPTMDVEPMPEEEP